MTPEKIYTVTCHSSINNGKRQSFEIVASFLNYNDATERLNDLKDEALENLKEIYGDQVTVIHDDDKCIVRTLNDDDILTIEIKITFLYR